MSSKRVYEIVDSEDEDDVVEVTSGPKKASSVSNAASEPGKGRQGGISSLLPSWSYAEIEALRFACGGDNARSAEVVFKLSQNPDGLTSEMRRSLIARVRASNPSPAPPLAPSPSPAQVSGKTPAWKRYAGESEDSFSGPSEGSASKAENAVTRPSPLPADTFSTTGFRLIPGYCVHSEQTRQEREIVCALAKSFPTMAGWIARLYSVSSFPQSVFIIPV